MENAEISTLFPDVTPVPFDRSKDQFCPINYPDEYQELMGFYRAVSSSEECSLRALELTKRVIEWNPAHYSIWHYRQSIIKHFFIEDQNYQLLHDERNWLDEFTVENKKNYQLWHHRQVLVELLAKIPEFSDIQKPCFASKIGKEKELKWLGDVLELDAKNYHAWTYRQWFVEKFDCWDSELEYSNHLINRDIRNNSAWNYRFFVLFHPTSSAKILDDSAFEDEIDYTLKKIKLSPNNESPWAYVRGIIRKFNCSLSKSDRKSLSDYTNLIETCNALFDMGIRSAHLLECLMDISIELHVNIPDTIKHLERAKRMCLMLRDSADTIRAKYWDFRLQKLNQS